MKTFISALALISAISVAHSVPAGGKNETSKVHFFVLVIPDSVVESLKRSRQEEGVEITETGAYVGQIISGVLGGDVRPIFAGSASFIGEDDVQMGVSTILANVAPSVNMILKQWFGRVQTALGIATTLRPGLNGTVSNGAIAGQNPAQLQQQTQQQQPLQQQQPVQQQQPAPGSLTYTNNANQPFETTTVEPLPLLKLTDNEDNEDENEAIKKV